MLRTPKADECVVIYETRRNRATGSHTQVIDLRPVGKKYALKCVTHDTLVERNVRLASEAESHRSGEWCTQCEGTHVPPTVKNVTQDDASEWDAIAASMQDLGKMTSDEVLAIIGGSTAQKACMKKIANAEKVAA